MNKPTKEKKRDNFKRSRDPFFFSLWLRFQSLTSAVTFFWLWLQHHFFVSKNLINFHILHVLSSIMIYFLSTFFSDMHFNLFLLWWSLKEGLFVFLSSVYFFFRPILILSFFPLPFFVIVWYPFFARAQSASEFLTTCPPHSKRPAKSYQHPK